MKSIGLDTETKTRSVLIYAEDPGVVQAKLALHLDFQLIGSGRNRTEVVSLATEHQPDLILFCWKADSDLALVRELRKAAPESGVVLWVNDLGPEPTREVAAMGVRAVLSATASPETFKQCLLISARGGIPASNLSALHRRRNPVRKPAGGQLHKLAGI